MNTKFSIAKSIVLLSLIYLLIPNIIFLCGWMQMWIAIPAGFCLLLACYITWQKSSLRAPGFTVIDYVSFFVVQLLLLSLTYLTGFWGQCAQSWDFNVRNPLYNILISDSLPISSQHGDYLIYYHAFWLVPAQLSKHIACGIISADFLLFVWTYIGLLLVSSLAFIRFRKTALTFIYLLIFGCMMEDSLKLAAKAHIPVISEFFNQIVGLCATRTDNYLYPSGLLQIWNTFHVSVPTYLTLALILFSRIPLKYQVFPLFLLAAFCPLTLIAILPFLAYRFITHPHAIIAAIKSPLVWSLFIPLICFICYYKSAQASSVGFLFGGLTELQFNRHSELFSNTIYRFINYIAMVLFMHLPIRFLLSAKVRHTIAYRCCIFLIWVCPLVYVGFENNEFMFKGAAVIWFLIAYMLATQLRFSSGKRRKALYFYIILCFILEIFSDWTVRAKIMTLTFDSSKMYLNKKDMGTTIFFPESKLYKNFFGKQVCPFIQRQAP